MFHRSLAKDAGTPFIFPQKQFLDFWMKDAIVPLAMIFIRKDGIVDSIARDEAPFSLANTFSTGPVIAALEVPTGATVRLRLQGGGRVISLPDGPPCSQAARSGS